MGLSKGLALLSGGEVDTMGSAPAGAMGGAPDMGGAPSPDLGAEAPEAGGAPMGAEAPEGITGREKRESIDYSRKLGMILAQSKKK